MSETRRWIRRAILGGLGTALVLPSCAVVAQEEAARPAAPQAQAPAAKRAVRHFSLFADNWSWTPDVIRVKQGAHVVLKLKAFRASRSFELKAYKLNVLIPQDDEVTVEFDADQKGEFPFRCGRPCGDGCAKMRGTFIVD